MDYKEQVKKYLEYCKYRKELDWNTLKAYKIDLRQFFEFSQEDMPKKSKIEDYITELHKKYTQKTVKCKLRSNGMPVPLLRNCYSIFYGTKYR